MPETSAFIFDMDGTLVDNMDYHLRSWIELFNGLDVQINQQEFHQRFSGKTTDMLLKEVIGEHLTQAEIRQFSETKESIYRELYRPHLRPVPGLVDFLAAAWGLSIPMAVATSAMKKNIDFVLGGLGLSLYFKVVIGAEDIRHSKPHPEIYLIAAERLGISPGSCIVFEDSLAGIEAARRAGMQAVVITTALSAEEARARESVIMVVKDYVELHPDVLING